MIKIKNQGFSKRFEMILSSQPTVDLEEKLIREYLRWRPVPNPADVFDQNGTIPHEVKDSPAYKGLADALMGRSSFAASPFYPHDNPSEAFQYACGYSAGQEFLKHKKRKAKETLPKNPAEQLCFLL